MIVLICPSSAAYAGWVPHKTDASKIAVVLFLDNLTGFKLLSNSSKADGVSAPFRLVLRWRSGNMRYIETFYGALKEKARGQVLQCTWSVPQSLPLTSFLFFRLSDGDLRFNTGMAC